jgi:hypothetical protein
MIDLSATTKLLQMLFCEANPAVAGFCICRKDNIIEDIGWQAHGGREECCACVGPLCIP